MIDISEFELLPASIIELIICITDKGDYELHTIKTNGYISKEKLENVVKTIFRLISAPFTTISTVKFYHTFDCNTTVLVNINYKVDLDNMSYLDLCNLVWGSLPYTTQFS